MFENKLSELGKKRKTSVEKKDISHDNKPDTTELQGMTAVEALFKEIGKNIQKENQKSGEQIQSELMHEIFKNVQESGSNSNIENIQREEEKDLEVKKELTSEYNNEINKSETSKKTKELSEERDNLIKEPKFLGQDHAGEPQTETVYEEEEDLKQRQRDFFEYKGFKDIEQDIKKNEPEQELSAIGKENKEKIKKITATTSSTTSTEQKDNQKDDKEGEQTPEQKKESEREDISADSEEEDEPKIDEEIEDINKKVSEIPEDFFYKVKKGYYCKDINLLKKIYEIQKSFPKTEFYLRNQDCNNVPRYNTIIRLIQRSFKSKLEYNTWKRGVRLRGIQEIAKKKGVECLFTDYKNNKSKLKFRCENGHIFEANLKNLKKRGQWWCLKCFHLTKLREVQEIAKKKGGECLSTNYKNSQSKLKFRCENGHVFEASLASVKDNKSWCPICFQIRNRGTLEEFKKIARERGGKCLSSKYINNRTKLRFQCKKVHVFEISPDKVKNRDQWCPICTENTGEKICRGLFETIFNKDFKKARPKWLKNNEGHQLELDGYNEELKLAFERQGLQHYKFITFYYKNFVKFVKQLSNDQEKNELCDKHRVILIEVPYWIRYDKMQDYIIEQCKAKGIDVPEIKFKIDWKKFKWDIDDGDIRSLTEWISQP